MNADETKHATIRRLNSRCGNLRFVSRPGLCGWFVCFAVSRPTLLGGFSYGSQTGRRHLPFLGHYRLSLLLLLRGPSGPLRGGDSGAASFTYSAALRWTHVIRVGCHGLWPAWTALTELRFDVGYFGRQLFELALITNEGHLQDGVVCFWLCLSGHFGSLPRTLNGDCVLHQSPRDLILTPMLSSYTMWPIIMNDRLLRQIRKALSD
jgi:hypothetical protein